MVSRNSQRQAGLCAVFSFLIFLCPVSSTGQENLLTNPGFDGSLAGWGVHPDAVHDPLSGATDPGAVYTEDTGKGGASFYANQCLDVTDRVKSEVFRFGAMVRAIQATYCWVEIRRYSDASCSVLLSELASPFVWSPFDWVPVPTSSITLDGTEGSVHYEASCLDVLGRARGWVDDAFFVEFAHLFVDGFESGDLSGWSFVMD